MWYILSVWKDTSCYTVARNVRTFSPVFERRAKCTNRAIAWVTPATNFTRHNFDRDAKNNKTSTASLHVFYWLSNTLEWPLLYDKWTQALDTPWNWKESRVMDFLWKMHGIQYIIISLKRKNDDGNHTTSGAPCKNRKFPFCSKKSNFMTFRLFTNFGALHLDYEGYSTFDFTTC